MKEAFDLKLTDVPAAAKIKIIKEIRAITGLGLKEVRSLSCKYGTCSQLIAVLLCNRALFVGEGDGGEGACGGEAGPEEGGGGEAQGHFARGGRKGRAVVICCLNIRVREYRPDVAE